MVPGVTGKTRVKAIFLSAELPQLPTDLTPMNSDVKPGVTPDKFTVMFAEAFAVVTPSAPVVLECTAEVTTTPLGSIQSKEVAFVAEVLNVNGVVVPI